MQRSNHFGGAAIMGAISAIDIALWDIKGKKLGVPIYELLGGAVRTSVRLYTHCKARTIEKLLTRARYLVEVKKFNAIGCLNPMLEEDLGDTYFKPHIVKMQETIDNVRRLREAVGPSVDLCLEFHNRLTKAEAIILGRAIEPFFPMYIEDPLPPTNLDSIARLADHIPTAIATGERFTNIYQFQNLLARGGVQYLRPCICVCGGITAGKKIAALAEAYGAQIVPHNPLSPINLAACLQLDASIPNFAIQEYPNEDPEIAAMAGLRGSHIVPGLPEPIDGFITIPNGPGLGLELPSDVERRFPAIFRPIQMRAHIDGSMVEQ
jgi:galactonate dehydratase